jgi:hypothetical protein
MWETRERPQRQRDSSRTQEGLWKQLQLATSQVTERNACISHLVGVIVSCHTVKCTYPWGRKNGNHRLALPWNACWISYALKRDMRNWFGWVGGSQITKDWLMMIVIIEAYLVHTTKTVRHTHVKGIWWNIETGSRLESDGFLFLLGHFWYLSINQRVRTVLFFH